MRATVVCLLFAAEACAQTLAQPPVEGMHTGGDTLRCEVTPIHPALSFGLTLQAGYLLSVPMEQYSGAGHSWNVLARVTPQSGAAVYLGSRFRLPPVPETHADGQVGGGFQVGEGHYAATLMLKDDSGRTCVREWQFDAQVDKAARPLQRAIPPGTVVPLNERVSIESGEPVFRRMTVLLHAAPVWSRAPALHADDILMWLGELAALLQQAPAKSVRLVVFNLAQQKELYRQEDFRLADLNRVEEVIYGLQLAQVDYRVLQNRTGDAGLLAALVNAERKAETPVDAVVFLGPRTGSRNKVPASSLEPPGTKDPRFFYVDFQRSPVFGRIGAPPKSSGRGRGGGGMRGGPGPPGPTGSVQDIISSMVSLLKGKTLDVYTPSDYATAIRRITGGK